MVGLTGEELFEARGLLPCCLLLMLAESPRHGYELADAARDLGFDWGHPTSLYRTLHRLEAAGLLRSEWQHGARSAPARRVYMLTAEGETGLESCADRAARFAVILRRYGSRYQALRRQGAKLSRKTRSEGQP